ncbi:WD repeat protein [Histomonas meleagridis]|uniref:WD repeat protein n=1 Tax=Histomonas meleagridis TaxID=135588 RepID=UPI003559D81A|nr:WD repeat protein [Histomonas meleagridis]KAH0800260.1 WD repeat protein [Histomonas meleagridis]
MDEVNFLIWRYMQENEFPHSAYVFETEFLADSTNINGSHIPPNALITLLQKSLIYLKLEKSIKQARSSSDPKIQNEIQNILSSFPNVEPTPASSEGVEVVNLASTHFNFFNGNSQSIECCSWSPNGTQFATLESDGIATIWTRSNNFFDKIVIGTPESLKSRCPKSIGWNHDGSLLAVATFTQTTIYTFRGDPISHISQGCSALQFNPRNNLLALCSINDYSISLWDVKLHQQPHLVENYQIHQDAILDICWRDEGKFATASIDKSIGLFTVSGDKKILHSHSGPFISISFSIDNSLFATGCNDGSIHIWKDEREIQILKGHLNGITSIDWNPKIPNIVASASIDGSVKIWDAISGNCHCTFAHHTDGVSVMKWFKSGEFLVTGGNDGIIAVWKMPEAKMVGAYANEGCVTCISIDPNCKDVIVCYDTSTMVIIPCSELFKQ